MLPEPPTATARPRTLVLEPLRLITSTRTGPVVILQRDTHRARCPTDAGVPSGFGEALARDDGQESRAREGALPCRHA
jgi:hypothetical protein